MQNLYLFSDKFTVVIVLNICISPVLAVLTVLTAEKLDAILSLLIFHLLHLHHHHLDKAQALSC